MATELSGLSIYTIASDGHTVEFPLHFVSGTLRDSYVRVAVDGEVDGSGNQIYRSFTKVPGDAGMIHINGTAPAAGTLITFQRVVPKDILLHLYSNGSILNYPSLDESHLQLLMCVQELMDGFGFQNISTNLNMNGRDIQNVGKLSLSDFSAVGAQSFREMLDEANAQLAINKAEVAKAMAQAALATSYATQAQEHSVAATNAATRAEDAALLVDPRMDAAEQDIATFKADVTTTLNVLSMFIGAVVPIACSGSYVPNGCVPANGGEYTREQFPALYDAYLVGGKLLTCTYEQQAAQVGLTGNCAKFALDTINQKFKVPLLKDGDSITQAASAAEVGKSVKAGLPNVTGEFPYNNNTDRGSGALYRKSVQVTQTYGIDASSESMYSAVALDASRSSSIYGNSTTVTDEQVRLRHFVVLASAQNSASVFDWSNYMTALAGKANADLSNVVLQPSMTGSATLNGTTDNTIQLTDIVTTLGLEVGDVIRIQYSGYDKVHSVESITNNNSIVVNYEHAGNRGNGSLKLADKTANVTVKRIAKWYNAPVGLGQAWVVVVRSDNTTYTNPYAGHRAVQLYLDGSSGGNIWLIDEIPLAGSDALSMGGFPVCMKSYKTALVQKIMELR